MLNWIVRNGTVAWFNCVNLEKVFTIQLFHIYVKTGFGFEKPTMVDMF